MSIVSGVVRGSGTVVLFESVLPQRHFIPFSLLEFTEELFQIVNLKKKIHILNYNKENKKVKRKFAFLVKHAVKNTEHKM